MNDIIVDHVLDGHREARLESRLQTDRRGEPVDPSMRDRSEPFEGGYQWFAMEPAAPFNRVPDSFRAEVGALLKRWRDAKGESQKDVQDALGDAVTASYLSLLENGRVPSPRLETILQLAHHYGVPTPAVWTHLDEVVGRSAASHPSRAAAEVDRRAREIDRVFEFVVGSPDFPTPKIDVPDSVMQGLSAGQKLVVVLLYERATGLSLLPTWVVNPLQRTELQGGVDVERQPRDSEGVGEPGSGDA